jgi:GxxExxY protein
VLCNFSGLYAELGPGLLENLYDEAMEYELKSRGIEFTRQKGLDIKYKSHTAGNYRSDYLIENRVIV